MGSLSKLEPPLFFRKLLVLEMRPSPRWGRKEEPDGEWSPRGVLRVHNTAVEEVGWLWGHWTWRELLAVLKIGHRAGATTPAERSWGDPRAVLVLRLLPALLRQLGASCSHSALPKSTKTDAQQSNSYLVPGLEERRSLSFCPVVSQCFPSILWGVSGLPCCAVVSALWKQRRRISFFAQWCRLPQLESIQKLQFVTSFLRPLNHAFYYSQRDACDIVWALGNVAIGWRSNLIFLGWFTGP